MTIAIEKDLSDVYNAKILKPLIPKVFEELHSNSVFSSIIDEMLPKGYDLARFGRLSQRRNRESSYQKNYNSVDGLFRASRTLDTDDRISIRVSIMRRQEWTHSIRTQPYGYEFSSNFMLMLDFIDEMLREQNMIKSNLHTLSFATPFLSLLPNTDFESYVSMGIVNLFNVGPTATKIQNEFENHKINIKAIHAATARY